MSSVSLTGRWESPGEQLENFPGCYLLESSVWLLGGMLPSLYAGTLSLCCGCLVHMDTGAGEG